MSKHTPGPWAVNGPFQYIAGDPELCISQAQGAPYTSESSDVCTVNQTAISIGTAMANARLIAAAPDMYELLKELSEDVDPEFESRIKELFKRIDQ